MHTLPLSTATPAPVRSKYVRAASHVGGEIMVGVTLALTLLGTAGYAATSPLAGGQDNLDTLFETAWAESPTADLLYPLALTNGALNALTPTVLMDNDTRADTNNRMGLEPASRSPSVTETVAPPMLLVGSTLTPLARLVPSYLPAALNDPALVDPLSNSTRQISLEDPLARQPRTTTLDTTPVSTPAGASPNLPTRDMRPPLTTLETPPAAATRQSEVTPDNVESGEYPGTPTPIPGTTLVMSTPSPNAIIEVIAPPTRTPTVGVVTTAAVDRPRANNGQGSATAIPAASTVIPTPLAISKSVVTATPTAQPQVIEAIVNSEVRATLTSGTGSKPTVVVAAKAAVTAGLPIATLPATAPARVLTPAVVANLAVTAGVRVATLPTTAVALPLSH